MNSPYDQIADTYDNLYAEPLSQAEDDVFLRRWGPPIQNTIDTGGVILDVGCGTGWLLDKFDIPPNRYVGFDISSGMIRVAKNKHPLHDLIVHDMKADWPIPAESVDLVTCLWASPNYDDEIEQLQLATKFLKPGGRLIYLAHAIGAVADGRIHQAGSYVPVECYTHGWRPWTLGQATTGTISAGLNANEIAPFRPIHAPPIRLPKAVHRARINRTPRDENHAVFLAIDATRPA